MYAHIEIKNGLMNMAQLQNKTNEIIFDNIDTTHNWEKAFNELNELFVQTIKFYKDYVDLNNSGVVPEENVYWTLFTDVAGRLIYFKTLAEKNCKTTQTLDGILEGYTVAAKCIQKNRFDDELELIDEISESYEALQLFNGKKGNFKQTIINNSSSVKDNLFLLYNYSKSI